MRMKELKQKYINGSIEKKLYCQLMRDDFLHVLPEIQQVIKENKDCLSIEISKEGCILTKSDNCKLYFDFTQSICRAELDLILENDPEKEEINYINNLLTQLGGNGSILDIGANVGLFTLSFYQKNHNYTYHLFEPVPSTFKALEKTIALNNISIDSVKLYNIGMSNIAGSFDFYIPASNEAASLVANTDEFYRKRSDIWGTYTGNDEIDVVKCKVCKLDDFVEENKIDNIKFIKIDVEGNEKAVLEGAKNTICKYMPIIYAELLRKHAKRFNYHPNDVIEFMRQLKYKCYTIKNENLVKVDEINDETEETNFIFIMEDE